MRSIKIILYFTLYELIFTTSDYISLTVIRKSNLKDSKNII